MGGREFDDIFTVTSSPSYPFCQVWDLILPHLQSNKLAYYCLMDSGRRHKTPGSETGFRYSWHSKRHYYQHICNGSSCSQAPLWVTRGPGPCYTCSGSVSHLRNTELKESTTFIASSKQACSLSWKETVPHISRLLTVNATLRNGSGKE